MDDARNDVGVPRKPPPWPSVKQKSKAVLVTGGAEAKVVPISTVPKHEVCQWHVIEQKWGCGDTFLMKVTGGVANIHKEKGRPGRFPTLNRK